MINVDVINNVSLDAIAQPSKVEPTAAKGGECVFFTEYRSFSLSTDGGATFQSFPWSSPGGVFGESNNDLFGDQSTMWAPQTSRFLWVMTVFNSSVTTQRIRLAFTGSAELKTGQARFWAWLDIDPSLLGITDSFDFPQLAIGANYLYITADLTKVTSSEPSNVSMEPTGAAWMRIALKDLEALDSHSVGIQYFVSRTSDNFGMAQHCGRRAYWASHERVGTKLHIYFADEISNSIGGRELALNPPWHGDYRSGDYRSLTPDGKNWVGEGAKISGTRVGPDNLVFGWTAGRNEKAERPEPYIYLVQVNQDTGSDEVKLVGIRHIWNREHAWAFPGLSSVPSAGRKAPVALSCGWGGGGRYFANHAVGFVDLPLNGGRAFTNKTVSMSSAGASPWGDFVKVGNDDVIEALFLTAGYEVQASKTGRRSVPHYAVFSTI